MLENLNAETIYALKNFFGERAITLENANVFVDEQNHRTVNISISLRGRATMGNIKRELQHYVPELWYDNQTVVVNGVTFAAA